MEDIGIVVAFWVLTVATLGGAIGVVAVRNLLHAVFLLILSFLGVAGLYITLSADFVAVTQILIYAGAIAILMIFAIMLTPRAARDNAEGRHWGPAAILGLLVAAILGFAALATDWTEVSRGPFAQTARAIGEALLDKYVLPFEVAGVLLTVALIGAVVLVREE